jgi:pilus assembly protein CpaF
VGKTELQKLLFGFTRDDEKIITIEDVREMHLKELYPGKDVYSWVTSGSVSIADEVKASLRNNPKWIVVSETRGPEAYEMYQSVLTGHNIATTVHAESAAMIPHRYMGMCLGAYQISESMLEHDILENFDFGIHIRRVNYKGRTLRYLAEILEFSPEGNKMLFKQEFKRGVFTITCGEHQLSEKMQWRMAERSIDDFAFPVFTNNVIEKKAVK